MPPICFAFYTSLTLIEIECDRGKRLISEYTDVSSNQRLTWETSL